MSISGVYESVQDEIRHYLRPLRKLAMRIRPIFFLLAFAATSWSGVAQMSPPDVGLVFGVSNYLGDIGNGTSPRRPFIYDVQLQETRLTIGAQAIYDFDRIWAVRGGLQYVGLGGDDVHTKYGPRRARNLHFRNNLIEASARAEGYWRPNQSSLSSGGMPALYAFAGLGIFYSNPQAREIGGGSDVIGVWQNLRPERTEGVSYSPIGIAIPFGIGAQWRVQGGWQVGVELCYRVTTTDYLDDISSYYAEGPMSSRATVGSIEAAGEGAGSLSNHSYNPNARTPRGNPNNNDGYGTLQVTLSKASPKYRSLGGRKGGVKRYPRHPAYWGDIPGR
jgi:hypothetical protein